MNIEINYNKKIEKHTSTWRVSDMLLNNEWANNKIKEEIIYLERDENENTMTSNLWTQPKKF